MQIAIYTTAAMAVLIFILGLWISILRARVGKIAYSQSLDDPTSLLAKVTRAHGSSVEFCPVLCVLILYLGTTHPPPWVIWTMVTAALSRYVAVAGFVSCNTLERVHPLKAAGALGTYITGVLLCIALIIT